MEEEEKEEGDDDDEIFLLLFASVFEEDYSKLPQKSNCLSHFNFIFHSHLNRKNYRREKELVELWLIWERESKCSIKLDFVKMSWKLLIENMIESNGDEQQDERMNSTENYIR